MAATQDLRTALEASFAEVDETETWLTCEQRDVLRALTAIKPAVYHRSPITAFTGVRVVSDEYGGHIWATNIDVAARLDLDFLDASAAPFDALVPYADFVQGLRVLGRGPVQLEAYPDGGHCGLRLNADHTTIALPGLESEDFPVEGPFEPDEVLMTTSAAQLATILDRAVPLCADVDPESDRLVLTGVCLDFMDGGARAVACEHHELCDLPITATVVAGAPNVVLPAGPLATITKMLRAAGDQPVTLATTRRPAGYDPGIQHVMFELDDGARVWALKAIDERYPSWRDLLPIGKRAIARIDLDVAELVAAVQDGMAMMKRDTPARLSIERENGVAKVYLRVYDDAGIEFEQVLVDADIKAGRSKPLTVGLDPKFLAHCANAVGMPRAMLTVHHPHSPLLMEAGANRCLFMPIKLRAAGATDH